MGQGRFRIFFIALAAALAAGLAPADATAGHDVPVLPDAFPKIRAVLSPLASQPAILEDGTTLRVELDPDLVDEALLPAVTATLQPSFGSARPSFPLADADTTPAVDSTLWPGRTVHAITFTLPVLGGSFVEDLYDLTITYGTDGDTQHRAVSVVDSYPEDPTFAILADPSVGDPRPLQEGAEDLIATGSPDSLIEKTTKTTGNPAEEDRWAALGKAIEEINLLDPDFVLVTGDLTFLLYPRPANIEYEDAYRILARLRVPAFLSPGNHDLYDLDYDDLDRPHTSDGKQLWPLYFGPLYYSLDVGSSLHLVGMNTFDWADDQREVLDEGDEFSTRAGGQIDDEQYAWLENDLRSYRSHSPRGTIVTFAHHDPSWIRARHPWPGKNRLESRDLLADLDVGVHFAGHTHEDRVARYHEGRVVETNGRSGTPGELHYVLRDNSRDETRSQEELGSILRDPTNGPLFVTTTTVSSVLKGSDWGLGSYWGYRFGVLDDGVQEEPAGGPACAEYDEVSQSPVEVPCGFDPIHFGYPATREFLEARAERPDRWNPDHAVYGVYSYPSYYLNSTIDGANDGTEAESSIHITNDLLVDVEIEVVLSVAGDTVNVTNGEVVWARSAGGITDVRLRVPIPSGSEITVTASGQPSASVPNQLL